METTTHTKQTTNTKLMVASLILLLSGGLAFAVAPLKIKNSTNEVNSRFVVFMISLGFK